METHTPLSTKAVGTFTQAIAVSGPSSSGTSSACERLHKKLGLRYLNAGKLNRVEAERLKMPIGEFAAYKAMHAHLQIDQKIDEKMKLFGSVDGFISEGRLVKYFTPNAFQVLLVCDEEIRVNRRYKQAQAKGSSKTLDQVRREIRERDSEDKENFKKLYGKDILWSHDEFHLVIDTGKKGVDEDAVCERIIEAHKAWVQAGCPKPEAVAAKPKPVSLIGKVMRTLSPKRSVTPKKEKLSSAWKPPRKISRSAL